MQATYKFTSDEESALFEAFISTGDKEARDLILEKYDYLPQILARRFTGRGIEFDDIYQCASIGLFNALMRYFQLMQYL